MLQKKAIVLGAGAGAARPVGAPALVPNPQRRPASGIQPHGSARSKCLRPEAAPSSTATTTTSAPQQQTQPGGTSGNGSAGGSGNGGSAVPKVTIDMAMAAKINAARELARRLAEEKQAAGAAAARGQDPETGKRAAESATAEAAVQAARADALVRALRRAEASRDQLSRLRMENEALRELILEVATDKEAARARVEQVLSGLTDQRAVERVRSAVASIAAASAVDVPVAAAASSAMDALGASSQDDVAVATMAVVDPVTEAQIVAASAEVAEFISPTKVTDTTDAAAVELEVDELRSVLQQKQADAPSEELVKDVVKKVELHPPTVVAQALESTAAAAASMVQALEKTTAAAASQALESATAALAAAVQATTPAVPPASAAAAPPPPPPLPKPFPPPPPPISAAPAVAAAPPQPPPMAPLAPPAGAPAQVVVPPPPPPMLPPYIVPAQPQRSTPAAAAAAASAAMVQELVFQPRAPEPRALEPAPPPPVVEVLPRQVPQPSKQQLQDIANRTNSSGKVVFTWPPEGGVSGQAVRVFYNRAKGPLRPSGRLQLKAGLNKWEEIAIFDMQKADLRVDHDQDWWQASMVLPSDLFRADFVVMDPNNADAVDNNNWKDYVLPLSSAPTEDEVIQLRAEAYRIFDERRRQSLEDEEKRLWRLVETQALDAAAAARVEFRRRRDQELLEAARLVVADRRKPEITAVPATTVKEGVYAWVGQPRASERCMLIYCRTSSGALNPANSVRVHLGYDGWWNQIVQVWDLSPISETEVQAYGLLRNSGRGGVQYFGGFVEVPYSAAVLNFVFSDRDQMYWDNNDGRDYHTLVQGAHTGDELVTLLHAAMKKETADKDKEVEDRAALRAVRKTETRGLANRKRRQVLQEFLYTLPATPRAGQVCDVYYSPDATMLRGRPEIWMRATWNRVRPTQQGGFPAVVARMTPCVPGGLGGFYKAQFQIPAGAWGVDLSFADNESMQGGFVDHNGGLDYHIAVEGASAPKPSMTVVHVAVEMAPIAKVGGMGDVVTALGRAVQEQGHSVKVVLPKYDCIDYAQVEDLRQDGGFNFSGTFVRVWKGVVEGLETTFLEPENGMFWVGCIYGKNNDAQRFGFFCGAALQWMKSSNLRADIVHCHDWQSAPVAWGDRMGARCVFTIHNLSYGADMIGRAMQACDVATTVSPTYAREISGHPAVAAHLSKLYGVLNGIDTDIWDPSEDPCLPVHFTVDTVAQGKDAARRALRERLGLSNADVPIVGCVTRLVAQKGIHLIKHAAWRTLERGGQFVLLGSAPDGRVQGEFNALRDQLARQYPGKVALVFQYDEPLSHIIYAGSDMFLVPSMFEPCGLTQMIAMRYGTIPVVRKTGGLVDTVYDVDHDEDRARSKGMETNGFSFEGTDFAGMDYALNRALGCWYSNRGLWAQLRKRAMAQDWSWNSPSMDYLELYFKARRG